ncbi:hypothetical protein [uncultured Massilia sp.]|uniref:hypothetical protein n=1 Tax=uncultured Massilia sp. TaxID=169973 RepID=UPI0025CFFDAF|nr:hypothetical protein [uncultured Massilia sp.]
MAAAAAAAGLAAFPVGIPFSLALFACVFDLPALLVSLAHDFCVLRRRHRWHGHEVLQLRGVAVVINHEATASLLTDNTGWGLAEKYGALHGNIPAAVPDYARDSAVCAVRLDKKLLCGRK